MGPWCKHSFVVISGKTKIFKYSLKMYYVCTYLVYLWRLNVPISTVMWQKWQIHLILHFNWHSLWLYLWNQVKEAFIGPICILQAFSDSSMAAYILLGSVSKNNILFAPLRNKVLSVIMAMHCFRKIGTVCVLRVFWHFVVIVLVLPIGLAAHMCEVIILPDHVFN